MKLQQQNFLQKVYDGKLNWTAIQPEIGSMITERYSHCCCYYDKSVYVFGGCTSTNTTLNDLWRFDLARREWIRPLATGMGLITELGMGSVFASLIFQTMLSSLMEKKDD